MIVIEEFAPRPAAFEATVEVAACVFVNIRRAV
jgi:hypothetical protein